jgi:hypothetical protein
MTLKIQEESMQGKLSITNALCFFILLAALLGSGCGGAAVNPTTAPSALPSDLPSISAVAPDRTGLPRYERIELSVTLKAHYTNPYDLRQVSLDGIFTAPDGKEWKVPGFWDGEAAWVVRFTPSQVGEWSYSLTVRDKRGVSQPYEGKFPVTASDRHGWLQAGNWVDPAYSGHYLVYQDGTPFYGVGFCNAFNIASDGVSADQGMGLFNKMKQDSANYVVWWPLYNISPIAGSYQEYSLGSLKMIDMVVADAQRKGVFLVFTVWDHPELRDDKHYNFRYPNEKDKWGTGNWARNGFNQLGDLQSFFTSAEAWAWQENFYRYMIARWGYSPAIGMWQTVAEINGTDAYQQEDPWHKKVNDYFVANDPYRHPTTASRSGGTRDIPWPEGHQVMDAPQVHIYDPLKNNPIGSASVLAQWTTTMWEEANKPNWVGEFGSQTSQYATFPEMYHNAIWASLASGASMTPAPWNFLNSYGDLQRLIAADLSLLAKFVSGLPLAQWNPSPLKVSSRDPQVRGWGIAGKDGGLFWVQDFSLEGKTMDEIRAGQSARTGVQVDLQGLAGGTYGITPYDTWQGTYLAALSATCTDGKPCPIALPDFKADMAFKIERK